MAIEKQFKAYIIVNWKTGIVRTVKRPPKTDLLLGSDIPLELNLTIKIPEQQELKLKAEVTLGQAEINNIALEAFEEE